MNLKLKRGQLPIWEYKCGVCPGIFHCRVFPLMIYSNRCNFRSCFHHQDDTFGGFNENVCACWDEELKKGYYKVTVKSPLVCCKPTLHTSNNNWTLALHSFKICFFGKFCQKQIFVIPFIVKTVSISTNYTHFSLGLSTFKVECCLKRYASFFPISDFIIQYLNENAGEKKQRKAIINNWNR